MQSVEDHQFELVETALQAMAAFRQDADQFDRMSKALSKIYFGPTGSLSEFAFAQVASLHPDIVEVLAQWLRTLLANTDLDGPRFGVNVALILRAGAQQQRPLVCTIEDAGQLSNYVEHALGVPGAKVAFQPVAVLASPLVEHGHSLAEWVQLVHKACANAQSVLDGQLTVGRSAATPPTSGTSIGADYILFGRATAPRASPGSLERALGEVSWKGVSVAAHTGPGRLELMPEQVGSADIVMPWLYSQETQQVASYLEHMLKEEGLKASDVEVGMSLRPGDIPQIVEVLVDLPEGDGKAARTRSTELGSCLYPAYLYVALCCVFNNVSYRVSS